MNYTCESASFKHNLDLNVQAQILSPKLKNLNSISSLRSNYLLTCPLFIAHGNSNIYCHYYYYYDHQYITTPRHAFCTRVWIMSELYLCSHMPPISPFYHSNTYSRDSLNISFSKCFFQLHYGSNHLYMEVFFYILLVSSSSTSLFCTTRHQDTGIKA